MESKLFRREEQICPAWPESAETMKKTRPRSCRGRGISVAQTAEKARRILLGEILLRRRNTQWAGIVHTVHECFSFHPDTPPTSTLTSCLIRFGFPGCRSTFLLMTGTISTVVLSRPTRKQSLTRYVCTIVSHGRALRCTLFTCELEFTNYVLHFNPPL